MMHVFLGKKKHITLSIYTLCKFGECYVINLYILKKKNLKYSCKRFSKLIYQLVICNVFVFV